MSRMRKIIFFILLIFVMSTLAISGCGESANPEQVPTTEEGLKLPPGVVEQGGLPESPPPRTEGKRETEAKPKGVTVDLRGGRFTIDAVYRLKTNKDVASSAVRLADGDYLEVRLIVENIGDDLLDLRQFEFRLSSPAIDIDDYNWNYPMGRPVDDYLISTQLISKEDLAPVTFSLKIGEVYQDGILFYDLNPKSVRRNEGFSPDTAALVIRKVRGEGAGEQLSVPLAGLIQEG